MRKRSSTREQLVIYWYRKSQKIKVAQFTIFDQFISLWLAFNSWGTYLSKADIDRAMLEYVKENAQLKSVYSELVQKDNVFHTMVGQLATRTVRDMRPGHLGDSTSITDISNFGQVLDMIYQIRCNLFHGQKNELVEGERELVELAFKILTRVFEPVITDLEAARLRARWGKV